MWLDEEEAPDTMKGQVSEDYEIIKIIGTGTFGKVYKVRDVRDGQIFAMKHVLQSKNFKNRELDIMKQINGNSNYAVKLIHHFHKEEKDGLFLNLIMEYVPEPLSKTIKTNVFYKKLIDQDTVIKYTKCLLIGLKDLHSMNIAHRDIKTSNILKDEDYVKLCDFGSAKILNSGHKNISYICSRYYRAPELLFGAIYYGFEIDIWSLGCVIAEMMTNHALFEGSNATSMISKIIKCLGSPTRQDFKAMKVEEVEVLPITGTGVQPLIQRFNKEASEQLIELVSSMLVYDPTKRITAAWALTLPLFNE